MCTSDHVWVGSGRCLLWGQERLGLERDVVNVTIITVRDKVPHIPSSCVIMQRICLYINIIQTYTVCISFSSVSVVLNTTVSFVNMDDIMCFTLLLKSHRSFFPQESSLSCSPPSCLSNLVHHFGFICIP